MARLLAVQGSIATKKANSLPLHDFFGWSASLILLITVSGQIYSQWQKGTAEGVSIYMFVGQAVASLGFFVYSWMLGSTVFVFTNGFLFTTNLVGYALTWRLKQRSEPV